MMSGIAETEYTDSFLKKQFFKAARTNKVEVFKQTMEKINNDLQQGMNLLFKKDPEGRNTVVICLVFSSIDVLQAIFETFSPKYDMRNFILKQEFDANPALNLSMCLAGFDKFRDRTEQLTRFLLQLASKDCSLPNVNNEESYTRYLNIPDRLGRTSLHMACMHGWPVDFIQQMVMGNEADVSIEDIEGQTPLHYAIDYDRLPIVLFFIKTFGFEKCLSGLGPFVECQETIIDRSLRAGSWSCLVALCHYASDQKPELLQHAKAVARDAGYEQQLELSVASLSEPLFSEPDSILEKVTQIVAKI